MGDEAVLERILNGDEEPTDLQFALLQRITNDFSEERKIGQGGYGKVYKGVYNGQEVAVKLFHDLLPPDNKHFENECVNLLRIRHPNIVRLLGYCDKKEHKYGEFNGQVRSIQFISRILCFEYLQGGSLHEYLNEESPDHDWSTRYNIIEGTCEGLNFLHEGYGSQILHLDLKPANILLDKYMGAKLAGFGLSRFFSKTDTHITDTPIGTEDYMPPEYLFKNQISPKNDVYSLGVTIIEIMAGRRGYSKFREMDDATPFIELVITNWRKWINATTSLFPLAELDQVETCIKIAIKCVDLERKNRPTVAEILDTMQETEKRFLEEWRNHTGFLVGQSLPAPTKSGPRGGCGGEVVDIKQDPWRLHSLTISYQGLIDAFSFSYIDQSGKKQRVGPWGEECSYHKTETIRFSPSEFVEEVRGAYGSHFENILVTSLTFVTNIRTYGPFGNSHHQNVAATPFRFMADEGSSIVAFHGRSGSHLFSIGVYMYPNNKATVRALSAPVILKGQKSEKRSRNETVCWAHTEIVQDGASCRRSRASRLQQGKLASPSAAAAARRTGSNPHHISLQHLKDITDNFSEDRILGRGGFGVVYKGVLQGEIVAVKKLAQSIQSHKQFKNEVDLLMTLEHPNIVRLVGYCYDTQQSLMPFEGEMVVAHSTECLLCLECMPNGSLDKYISDVSSGLDWHKRCKIIEGISFGLQYLHEQANGPIIHLDLKPANILLGEDLVPKITDFGLSRLFDKKTMHTTVASGTLGYMAVEYQQRGIITPMADIFSLGVIILEVITGHRDYPYDIRTHSEEFIKLELQKWRNRLHKEPVYTLLEIDCQQIERYIQIGLICVNTERGKRPTMNKIIDMLQGLESMDCYIRNELSSQIIMEEP